jgi:hypothetical protein
LSRDVLIDALQRQCTAALIADKHGVSVSTACRALRREGLQTAMQATRRRAAERYAELLADAERAGTADPAQFDWLRRRVR